MIDVELRADGVPDSQAQEARERLAAIDSYTDDPILSARLTLRRTGQVPPYVADATVLVNGRLLAAHAAEPNAVRAAEEVTDRLRRQLRRVEDTDVALRNDPRTIRRDLESLPFRDDRPEARAKPPGERQVIRRFPYSDIPLGTLDAVAEMLDIDVLFHLFLHVRTGEWVVVYRRDDGQVGLIHPQASVLADENDVVVSEPSRYSDPLPFEEARTEMDVLNHRFLYFTDEADDTGKALYLRHDGDYGLVEPE